MKPDAPVTITQTDVDNLTRKLTEFAQTLDEKEQRVLIGVLELAGKMYEGTRGGHTAKPTLPLIRETIRQLNVWDRLIETQGHSLWTCDRPPVLGEDVINPRR